MYGPDMRVTCDFCGRRGGRYGGEFPVEFKGWDWFTPHHETVHACPACNGGKRYLDLLAVIQRRPYRYCSEFFPQGEGP